MMRFKSRNKDKKNKTVTSFPVTQKGTRLLYNLILWGVQCDWDPFCSISGSFEERSNVRSKKTVDGSKKGLASRNLAEMTVMVR